MARAGARWASAWARDGPERGKGAEGGGEGERVRREKEEKEEKKEEGGEEERRRKREKKGGKFWWSSLGQCPMRPFLEEHPAPLTSKFAL